MPLQSKSLRQNLFVAKNIYICFLFLSAGKTHKLEMEKRLPFLSLFSLFILCQTKLNSKRAQNFKIYSSYVQ